MKLMDNTYGFPNVGCLLGKAYQNELTRLASTLNDAHLDISPAEYLILRVLYHNGPSQQCEISRIISKDKASVSRTVTSMAKKGLVDTSQISHKCCIVALTDKGEALRQRTIEIAKHQQADLEAKLSVDELNTLFHIMKKKIQQ